MNHNEIFDLIDSTQFCVIVLITFTLQRRRKKIELWLYISIQLHSLQNTNSQVHWRLLFIARNIHCCTHQNSIDRFIMYFSNFSISLSQHKFGNRFSGAVIKWIDPNYRMKFFFFAFSIREREKSAHFFITLEFFTPCGFSTNCIHEIWCISILFVFYHSNFKTNFHCPSDIHTTHNARNCAEKKRLHFNTLGTQTLVDTI